MIEMFSKAVSDCLDEEISPFNTSNDEDAIFSGLKNLISDECVEFREDSWDDYRIFSFTRNSTEWEDRESKRLRCNQLRHTYNHSASFKPNNKRSDFCDDELSEFLTEKSDRIYQDIPNLIMFKPKNRKRHSHSQDMKVQDRISKIELNGKSIGIKTKNSQRRIELAAVNKGVLKPSRRKGNGKLRFLKIQKPRMFDS